MQKTLIVLVAAVILLALVGCSGSSEMSSAEETIGETSAGDTMRLSAGYAGALSIQGQLALGTLRLEETDQAVDEELAAELLPLWQALQSLSNSETTAEAELVAVINQIQDTMSPDQIQAIAEMQLTEDGLTQMLENGELAFGGFGGRAFAPGNGDAEGNAAGGGFRGPDFGPGGGPGAGPGGGPGGGFIGGPGLANLSEDDIATRRAEFAESGFGTIQERMLTGAVVRLLQTKTGEAPEPRGLFDTVFSIVSEETGLSVEEIRSQTSEGAALAEIIETNGGDVEAVRASLVEALSELPNAADLDVEQMANDWLGTSQ